MFIIYLYKVLVLCSLSPNLARETVRLHLGIRRSSQQYKYRALLVRTVSKLAPLKKNESV